LFTIMTSCLDRELLDQKPVIDIKPEIRTLGPPSPLHPMPDQLKSPEMHHHGGYLPDMYGMKDPLAGPGVVHCPPNYNVHHQISPIMVIDNSV